MVTIRYGNIPKADPKARRYLVQHGTQRVFDWGLRPGDVIEVTDAGVRLLSHSSDGPPRKRLDSLIVAGELVRLQTDAGAEP